MAVDVGHGATHSIADEMAVPLLPHAESFLVTHALCNSFVLMRKVSPRTLFFPRAALTCPLSVTQVISVHISSKVCLAARLNRRARRAANAPFLVLGSADHCVT